MNENNHPKMIKKIPKNNEIIYKEQNDHINNHNSNEYSVNTIKNLETELEKATKKVNKYYKFYMDYKYKAEEKINNLEKEKSELGNKYTELVQIKNELEKQNETILKENDSKNSLIKDISNYENVKKEMEELSLKVIECKKKIKDLEKQNEILEDSNKKLASNNKNFQEELEEKNKVLNELDNENKISKEKMTKQQIDMNILYEQKNKVDIDMQENHKIIDELQKNNKELLEEINNNKNEYISMKKELEETHSKFDGAISQFENMNNQIKEQEKKLEEYQKYKEENKELREKYQKIEKAILKSATKEEYLVKSAEEYYDVVIDINSIISLKNEGWSIKYNKERASIYEKIISKKTIKIGVLGINNVGKSFLLSKLVKSEIPTGYSVETKGISIKYAKEDDINEEKGICILDSAGFETPLLREEKVIVEKKQIYKDIYKNENVEQNKKNELEKAMKSDEIEMELSRDKAQTERFIEQLILSLSDMIILVIGKLTRREQKLITRIKNEAKMNEKNRIDSIIIVHNLAQYHTIKEVEKHIKQYLNKSATFRLSEDEVLALEKYRERKYLFESSDEPGEFKVFHYIMAKEGTEAGNYYNNLTLELIKQQYNICTKRRAINIPEEIINLFSDLSLEITGEKMECERLGKDKNIIKLKNNPNNLKKNKKLYIQNTYSDQDGNFLRNKYTFEPKYSLCYYTIKKEDEDNDDECEKYLLLRLELPGNIERLTAKGTNQKKGKFKGIFIKGYKKKDEFKEQSFEDFTIIRDNRSYDEFSYFIDLPDNLILYKLNAIEETSIYEILFNKRNKEKILSKDVKQNNDNNKKEENHSNEQTKSGEIEDSNSNLKHIGTAKIGSGVYVMKFILSEGSYV